MTEVALLDKGTIFSVVEFGADGITGWEVWQDKAGVPRARHWPCEPASDRTDPSVLYEHRLRPLTTGRRLLIIFDALHELYADAFEVLRAARPEAPVYYCTVPLASLLRDVIAEIPLTCWYELVVLRQTESRRLVLDSRQLFPPGAQRGYREQFRIRCEPSDEHGTVFAVVAVEARRFQLVSVQSAAIAPGVYEPTAVLLRPGHVDFQGLPGKLRTEPRRWPSLVSAVPARLDRPPPTHLVCVIEVSGPTDQFRRRIDRIQDLIAHTDGTDGQLSVSLISYGPHAFDRRVPDEPAKVLAWAADSKTVLLALDKLGERKLVEGEYPRAAQLECALTEVARLLSVRDGRPVLVTAGSRPPFPPRVDIRSEILPCPDRRDWRRPLQKLYGVPGITFGALPDQDADAEIWTRLGREALEPLDVVDVRRFAADLGLCGTAVPVPFPLIDTNGG